MALMLGKGNAGVHIVAHDMEIFRHDGMFVREHQGYLFLFLFAHGGKLCNDGKGGDGIQVMPVFDLVVEYGRAMKANNGRGLRLRPPRRERISWYWEQSGRWSRAPFPERGRKKVWFPEPVRFPVPWSAA